MQSKGAIRFVAIILAVASLWVLSFTGVSMYWENKAEDYAAETFAQNKSKAEILNEEIKNLNGQIAGLEARKEAEGAEFTQAAELDSLKAAAEESADELDALLVMSEQKLERHFVDSISHEKIYLGYTYKDVKEREINLGLDLKGGMNIMLQVQFEDLVKALGNPAESNVAAFNEAIAAEAGSGNKFIENFVNNYTAKVGEEALFTTFEKSLGDKISKNSDAAEITKALKNESESAINNSFNVLRNRIDRFGVTSPNIQKVGEDGRILVELPGVKDPERVRNLLKASANLEFWRTFTTSPSAGDNDANRFEKLTGTLEKLNKEAVKAFNDDRRANMFGDYGNGCIARVHEQDTATVNKILRKARYAEMIPMWSFKADDNHIVELVAIYNANKGRADLGGEVVTEARVQTSDYGRGGSAYSVSMTMNAEGANKWKRITEQSIGQRIAIVLDGMVYSYPNVNDVISGGSSEISGDFTLEEAEDLANVLKSGKLPAPASIIQEQIVGPSLGARSIKAGLISFVIAFVLVLIYMILFYHGAGLVADLALLCNVLLLLGSLVSFHAVLTLPGIAGLVLTLGMAVDANVIIYERVKEELRAGKGLSKAIADGYSNAYSAIIDGQLTTIITGVVLFVFGSGPVQGFATTLIIGIVTSILTSIFITRLVFDDRVCKGKNVTFDNKLTRNFLQNTHVDFIAKRKFSYIFSGALIIISIASICFKGFTYGVDFMGGRSIVVELDKNVAAEEVRKVIRSEFNITPEVKQFGGENQMKITMANDIEKAGTEEFYTDEEVSTTLYNAFIKNGFVDAAQTPAKEDMIKSADKVGASIAEDIQRDALIAVFIALIAIFGYIAVRFKGWTWGLGGVLGLAHTAIIVIGFFSLFTGILPFNLDIDQTFIAAILTIIGYAINDTVVIFDRIREFRGQHPNADLKATTNEALNSTLSRTMNTSVTTLVVMLAIAIFGGEVIRGLSIALILGVVIGTYASIFIATPIMFDATNKIAAKADKKALKASK